MGRKRIYTDQQRKERKKMYDIRYQNKRYKEDREFCQMKKIRSKNYYIRKNEPQRNVEVEIQEDKQNDEKN